MSNMVYPSRFTPGGSTPSPAFANVLLLVGANGADASTTIPDESSFARGNATVAGNAQIDTAFTKFGTGALLLDGTGDFISFPDSGDWDMGNEATTDMQWEAFVRFTSGTLSNIHTFVSHWSATGNARAWQFRYRGDTGNLELLLSSDGIANTVATSVAWSPSADTWYHVAANRTGGRARLFVDGVKMTDVANTQNPNNSTAPMRIGGAESGGSVIGLFTGHMDEIRIVKSAVGAEANYYTANFTPPPAAFPRS